MLDSETESLRRRVAKETEALAAANARAAELEASLSEAKKEQQKLIRRVDEADTHAAKLIAHSETLMNDLAAVKVRGCDKKKMKMTMML